MKSDRVWTEKQIEVGWGHVAICVYGEDKPSGRQILAIHGRSNNAAGMMTLIENMNTDGCFAVAMDLPGHGHSSSFPNGLPYCDENYLSAIMTVVSDLKWKRFSLIGHSLGGHLAALFTLMYPEMIEHVVILDCVYFSFDVFTEWISADCFSVAAGGFKRLSREQPQQTEYECDFNDAAKMFIEMSGCDLTEENVQRLLERSLVPLENGRYIVRYDNNVWTEMPLRLSCSSVLNRINESVSNTYVSIIASKKGYSPRGDQWWHTDILPNYKHTLEKAVSHTALSDKMHIEIVEGDHMIVASKPKMIASIIDKHFLESSKRACQSKL